MDLEWSTPLDDGNAAITSYHIEAKEKGHEEDWQIWETIDTNRTKATVNGLQKGREYQFRVIAINKAGKSDPSHPSRTKEALPRSRKPNFKSRLQLRKHLSNQTPFFASFLISSGSLFLNHLSVPLNYI